MRNPGIQRLETEKADPVAAPVVEAVQAAVLLEETPVAATLVVPVALAEEG